jgi:hypothetical protein
MISRQANQPPYNAPSARWSWLFPLTYLLHIAEEYWGGEGYSAYLLRSRGIQLSPERFLMVQAFGLALVVVGINLARRFKFPNQLSVILGSVVLVNGLTHTILTLLHTEYVPGSISSLILWIPLGIATLVKQRHRMRATRYWLYVALGVPINGIVELVTSKAGVGF